MGRNGWVLAAALLAALGCDNESGTDAGPGGDAMVSCDTGETSCDGVCVDTDSDRSSCGSCGNACAAGESCTAGACELSCPTSQTVCGSTCHDTSSDRAHCGACDAACGEGEICTGGSCEITCPSGQTVCGSTCHDTTSDPLHCGGCGSACLDGEVCMAGTCAASCGSGTTDCSGACVDTVNNPAHCGACDAACPGDASASGLCVASACRTVCDAGTADCDADLGVTGGNGCETATATAVDNCGACGLACVLDQATAGCAAGACTVSACDAGFDDCDTMASTGCEADITTDVMNCGACGTVCAATESCISGACATPAGEDCAAPWVLAAGANTVAWTATTNDYLTTTPSCVAVGSSDGPDVVLSYTATIDGFLTWTLQKPASTRWAVVVSDAACGTLTPEIECVSEFTPTSLTGSFAVTTGTTYYWYVVDTTSGAMPLSSPLLMEIMELVPPCSPGVSGVVGTTLARVTTTAPTTLTEYYMAADSSPTGFIYFGGVSQLFRVPKAGGSLEDVEALAGIGAAQLGYDMLIDGTDIYVLNSATSSTTGHLWRISDDGGATWIAGGEDYASFAVTPNDDFRGVASDGTTIFLITEDFTETQIWSVPAGIATVPNAATLVTTIPNDDCTGLAVDSTYLYLACAGGTPDQLIRVHRTTFAIDLLNDTVALSGTHNSLHVDDNDSDGVADVIYMQVDDEAIYYTCGLSGAPFTAALVTWGTGTTNYGLGFEDGATPVLWSYDDDTEELINVR